MTSDRLPRGRRWPPAPSRRELDLLADTARSQQWTDGPWTARVEEQMRELTGAACSVAFNSCTSAIHAALLALGCCRGTPVTVPALSFAGTVTGAAHIGAALEFTDVAPDTLNARPRPVQGGIAIAVDLHGVPHGGPREAADGTPVLTDSCQALGSMIDGEHAGRAGTHAWSFSSAKLAAAPDGGAVTTSNPDVAAMLRMLRDYGIAATPGQARANGTVVHAGGHNWRPSELSMTLASSRLQDLHGHVQRAREVTERVSLTLTGLGLWQQKALLGHGPAWHKIRFGPPGMDPARCRRIEQALTAAGVETHRWGAVPLHRHPAFTRPGQQRLPVAETATAGTLCLGTEACPPWTWNDTEAEHVCQTIERTIGELD
jgi:perosamine synthetase